MTTNTRELHPADARTLRRLRLLAQEELNQLSRGGYEQYSPGRPRILGRAQHRISVIVRLIGPAAAAVVASAAFAFAALVPATPTPFDPSLPPAGVHPGAQDRAPSIRPGVTDDPWAGFAWWTVNDAIGAERRPGPTSPASPRA